MKALSLLLIGSLSLAACTTQTPDTTTNSNEPEVSVQEVFPTDFEDVCNGIPQSKGTAYTETAGTHPVVLFSRESSSASYYETSYTLPEAWQLDWQEAEKFELVTCVTTEPKEMAESCEYDIEGDAYTLNTYSADYQVNLYAATTGTELASTKLSLPADPCPSLHFFSEKTENHYPDYSQSLTEFLKPYAQK